MQVLDKTRLIAYQTYVAKGEAAITLVEIEPESGAGFINVTGMSSDDWFLDWDYATDGIKDVSLRVTTDGPPVTSISEITVLSAEDDKLFSTDDMLRNRETAILKFLPKGKSSYKYVHRAAQHEILEQLYKDGYYDFDGSKLTLDNILDISEFSQWSKFIVLRMIYRDLSNAIGDIYDAKSLMYEKESHMWRTKAILRVDINNDGILNKGEGFDLTTRRLIRV